MEFLGLSAELWAAIAGIVLAVETLVAALPIQPNSIIELVFKVLKGVLGLFTKG